MSDQGIPPGWYPNPENQAEERYWAGYEWTEHVRPCGHAGYGTGLRPAGDTIGQSFRLMGAHWRAYGAVLIVAGLPLILVSGVLVAILYNSASEDFNDLMTGQVAQETDLETLDLSIDDPGTLALYGIPLALVAMVLNMILNTALYHQAYWQLTGSPPRPTTSLRLGLSRTPRLIGVALQIILIVLVMSLVLGVLAVVSPVLAVLGFLALIPAAFLGMVVFSLAFVVASIGPPQPSLKTGWELSRGSFWAILGRIILVFLISLAVGIGTNLATLGTSTLPTVLASSVAAVALVISQAVQTLLWVIALAVIYHDLGGPVAPETDTTDPVSPLS
ncbi:MAG: DUF2510 domain-containing protein [Actinomycetia bacterium]|nr:DUF2510 domain-containing protein [Actinomycetes bacterium]